MSSMIPRPRPRPGSDRLKGPLAERVREHCLLEGLVEAVEGGGAAPVGKAGADKTVLLAHAAEVASKRVGLRALRHPARNRKSSSNSLQLQTCFRHTRISLRCHGPTVGNRCGLPSAGGSGRYGVDNGALFDPWHRAV